MVRYDLPDNATEVEVEAFLSTLEESSRAGVRELLLQGAGEAEINEYLEGAERRLFEEDEAGFEDEEPREE
jgi:hypothetical protein